MNLSKILESIHESDETSSPEELAKAVRLIVRAGKLTGGEVDTIIGAFKNGPIYDGDVPSKSARDGLLSEGFMAKVIVKGEDGFNALTYRGAMLYSIMEAFSAGSRDTEIQNLCRARTQAIERAQVLDARREELEDLLSSVRLIALRGGKDTNWQRLDDRIASFGISAVSAKPFKILPSDNE